MEVSEDGTVTGSIDMSKLDQIKPKTDEAKAQIDALKAEAQAGQEPVAQEPAQSEGKTTKADPATVPKTDDASGRKSSSPSSATSKG
jgi:hypothetical protein